MVAELADDDLGALNRFLAARDIYADHLARRQASLEDVFMELTGSDGHMTDLAKGGVA